MLTKRVTKTGSSGALILDKPLLELLGAAIGDELTIEFQGDTMLVRRAGVRSAVMAAARETLERHGSAFEKLAK